MGSCVHRLLELFSVGFGFSESQLKVRFSAFRLWLVYASRPLDRKLSTAHQLLCLSELMQDPYPASRGITLKISWDIVKTCI